MSFTTFVSEFFAAAAREFLLRRPVHAEFTRTQGGNLSFRVSLPPVGETAARPAEVHYHSAPPPLPYYPPSPWGGWPGNGPPYQQERPAPPPEKHEERREAPQQIEHHETVVIPPNWRP